MEPVVAIRTLLLQTQLPEITLRPGTSVVGRVASRGEAHGVLVIAGVPLTAQLPEAVGRAGDTLRLSVSEVTPERVALQLEQVIPPGAGPAAPERRRSPRVRVEDPPRAVRAGGEERSAVALSFHSTSLGRLDLRLELVRGKRVSAAVESPAGPPFALVHAAAGRLQDGLRARTGLDADVRLTPRREPLDVYA